MSKEAINYLRANKNKYTKEALVKSLEKVGYQSDDIKESIKVVFGASEHEQVNMVENKNIPHNFWDFKNVFIYKNKTEKIVDYIIGVVFPCLVSIIVMNFDDNLFFVPLLVYIFAIIYFKHKRLYLYRGLMLNIYLLLIMVVFSILALTLGIGHYWF